MRASFATTRRLRSQCSSLTNNRPLSNGQVFNGRNRLYQNALNPNALLNVDLIRECFSVGFSDSTTFGVGFLADYDDGVTRISFGQETKPKLIERFWMVSRELSLEKPLFSSEGALNEVKALVGNRLV